MTLRLEPARAASRCGREASASILRTVPRPFGRRQPTQPRQVKPQRGLQGAGQLQADVPSLFTLGSSLRSGRFTSQVLLTKEGITLSSSSLSSSRITGMVSRMSCICSNSWAPGEPKTRWLQVSCPSGGGGGSPHVLLEGLGGAAPDGGSHTGTWVLVFPLPLT